MFVTMLQGFFELLYPIKKLEVTSKLIPCALRIPKWNPTFVLKYIITMKIQISLILLGGCP